MDRAHRIGQKNPVLVFRLVTANTIEEKILEKAAAKRKLETLIIGQG
jgi:SNF2 family DNA or RNA helicase